MIQFNDNVPRMSARPPTIAKYHIEQTIGYGGMETVYLGRHTLLGRAVAIKVLLPALSRNKDNVERFFNEARALSRITDPGVVQVFDFGHLNDGRAFIVMEFLEGESLHARLKRVQRIDAGACLRLSRLICSSLAAVHAKGLIHRDLKPESFFIVDDASAPGGERAKLLDLGIARQTREPVGALQADSGVLPGTPMYMSPEQCGGGADIDHRTDIYSIACVMFTMLAGQPPFGGRSPRDLVEAHLREPAPLASSIAPGVPVIVDDILQCCLKKSPEDRYQSIMELAHAIGAAEQALTATTTFVAPAPAPAPAASVRALPSAAPSLDGQLAALDTGGPRRRRWIAGAVIVTASLLGVLCAIVISADGGHGGAPMLGTSAAQAATRSSPMPQPRPDVVAPAAPGPPSSAPASRIAGSPSAGGAGEIAPLAPATPPPPSTTGSPSPGRPLPSGKHPSNPDTRGDHANARQRAAPSIADLKKNVSQNVTRGD
jgi:eukaryotic-like serine/threonine-protein kinase